MNKLLQSLKSKNLPILPSTGKSLKPSSSVFPLSPRLALGLEAYTTTGERKESPDIPWQSSAFLVEMFSDNIVCRDRNAQQLLAIYLATINEPHPKVLTEFSSSLPLISVIILPDKRKSGKLAKALLG